MTRRRRAVAPRRARWATALVVAVSGVTVLVGPGCGPGTAGEPSDGGAAPTSGAPTSPAPPGGTDVVAQLGVRVLRRVPHDTAAFTEGLVFDRAGRLVESVGRYGRSAVRRVDLETGDVLVEQRLDDDRFGEGLAVGPDGLVQLTWKEGEALRWAPDDLAPLESWGYEGEGWGLTFDPERGRYIRSDGSGTLHLHDQEGFAEVGTVEVTRAGEPTDELNELELVGDDLYANVWHRDEILRIDPATGRVTGVIDAAGLWEPDGPVGERVLNGIAHRPGDPPDRLWLTGKEWPHLVEVQLVER